MAGIGFELRKMLREDSYFATLKAYIYASLISSGPWLMSILCLAIIGLYRGTNLGDQEHQIFRSTVIYIFASSLVFIGFFQLVTTRYLADMLYDKQHQFTLRTLFTSSLLVLALGLPAVTAFFWTFEFSLFYKCCAIVLFMVICLIWLSMIFVSSVKDYLDISLAFAVGTGGSIAGAIFLGGRLGLEGYILGFLIGQSLIFFWLLSRLLTEYPPSPLLDRKLLTYFGKYWDLLIIGGVYNLAIWIDKVVFWLAPDSRLIIPWLRVHDIYESPVFFSYLTIVPTMAIFMLKVETKFYEYYQNYYAKVVDKRSLRSIREEKGLLIAMLKEQIREIFIVQGIITGICIVFAPQIAEVLQFNSLQIPLLRVALVGSFLQVLLLLNIIILFYFDLRKRVLAVSCVFCLSNGWFSYISVQLGEQFYGYGYCYACFISLLLAFALLSWAIENLEYLTFAKQPV